MALHDPAPWQDGPPIPAELAEPGDAPNIAAELIAYREDAHPGVDLAEWIEARDEGGWRIRDDETAEWALRRIAEARAQLDEINARYDRWLAQMDDWRRRVAAEPERTDEFLRAHLEVYARRRHTESGQASVILPSGKVVSRSVPALAQVEDEATVVEWAREHQPGAVTYGVRRKELRVETVEDRVVDPATGEVVPGMTVRPGYRAVSVQIEGRRA